jgi:hypothetical protein
MNHGAIVFGPVPIKSGGHGKETPVGTHHVQWKHRDHYSSEFPDPGGDPRGAPMPNAVFFADGGVAFHGTRNDRPSAGCVKLRWQSFQADDDGVQNSADDSKRFFDYLQVDDEVQVHRPAPPPA